MDKRVKLILTFGFAVFLVSGLYLFSNWFSLITGYFTGADEKTQLAQCLDGKYAEFYGTEFCAECERQEKLFGNSFRFIYYVDCGKDMENCPNIKEIPAWYIKEEFHYGFKNITELQDLSGCEATELPKRD